MRAERLLSSGEWASLFWRVAEYECGWGPPGHVVVPSVPTRAEFRGLRALAALVLMGECGLRVQEASRLEWHFLMRGGRLDVVVSVPGDVAKGGRAGEVVLTPAAYLVLEEWRRLYMERWPNWGSGTVLKVGDSGRGYTTRGLQKLVRRLGARHLDKRISPHTLRRTYGDRVRRVADVRIAQLMLRHARLSSTERYLGGDRVEQLSAAARLSGELFATGPPGVSLGPWVAEAVVVAGRPSSRVDTLGRP